MSIWLTMMSKYIGLGGKQTALDITKTRGTLTIANNDKNQWYF